MRHHERTTAEAAQATTEAETEQQHDPAAATASATPDANATSTSAAANNMAQQTFTTTSRRPSSVVLVQDGGVPKSDPYEHGPYVRIGSSRTPTSVEFGHAAAQVAPGSGSNGRTNRAESGGRGGNVSPINIMDWSSSTTLASSEL